MTVMTFAIVDKQPAALRGLIGKYLAAPRWSDTCDLYNQLMPDNLFSCSVKTASRKYASRGNERRRS